MAKPLDSGFIEADATGAPLNRKQRRALQFGQSEVKSQAKSEAPVNKKRVYDVRKKPQEVSYGEKVKRRRMEAAAKLDDNLSLSQKRKLVVKQEALMRNPNKAFDSACGVAYNLVLHSVKCKEDRETRVSEMLAVVFESEDSPLRKLEESAEAEEMDRIYSRPSVARALQTALKFGNEEQRRLIKDKIGHRFSKLCQYPAGHHLCAKLFRYLKSPQDREDMFNHIISDPRSFFTRFGCQTWDFVLRQLNFRAKFRNPMLMRLFFEKVVSVDIPKDKLKSMVVEDVFDELQPRTLETLKKSCLETIDLLVKKEMLKSYLVQIFLSKIVAAKSLMKSHDLTEINSVFEKVSDETKGASDETKGASDETKGASDETKATSDETKGASDETEGASDETKGASTASTKTASTKTSTPFYESVSEAIFDGSHQLLLTKEGVFTLATLCGYWTSKERKQFLANIKTELSLGQSDWSVYFENEVDAVFVVRLLETIDDTKLSGEQILGSIFKFRIGKDGFLRLQDKEQIVRILMNPLSCSMLVRLLKPELCRSFLLQHELALLDLPSPTSRKSQEMRRFELCGRYLVPALKEFKIREHEVLTNVSDTKHQKMLKIIEEAVEANDDDESPKDISEEGHLEISERHLDETSEGHSGKDTSEGHSEMGEEDPTTSEASENDDDEGSEDDEEESGDENESDESDE